MILEPRDFSLEQTTMWSFPERGNWATHSGEYRGNWSPYIPRNIIMRYSNPCDWVLDQFAGSGTTLVEACLLKRNAIGVDVNQSAIDIMKGKLDFELTEQPKIVLKKGDARKLDYIKAESIDLICTHPPYADIIKYSSDNVNDLSHLSHTSFLNEMKNVAEESYRVLKSGKICAIMMGDMRQKGRVIPLAMETMEVFLSAGFCSKEIIIKEQHNCKSTGYWEKRENNFLLLAHEYIFVFEK